MQLTIETLTKQVETTSKEKAGSKVKYVVKHKYDAKTNMETMLSKSTQTYISGPVDRKKEKGLRASVKKFSTFHDKGVEVFEDSE